MRDAEISAEIQHELEEIGLTRKAGWISAVALFGSGGSIILLVALLTGRLPPEIQLLGGCALLMAVFSLYGLVKLVDAEWAAHVRVLIGLAIITAGSYFGGDATPMMTIVFLFPLMSPAYLYVARRSLPYALLGPWLVFGALISNDARWSSTQAVVTPAVLMAIVLSLIASQTSLRRLVRKHHELAFSDPLTGLANTRRLRENIDSALSTAARTGEPLALLAIDLDNFKQVNDRNDHSTGDAVLRGVAQALIASVDPDDIVARRGGDEFSVMIWSPVDRDLESLRSQIAENIVEARADLCPDITPSASVGYVWSTANDTVDTLIERADDALHESKRRFHASNPHLRREPTRTRSILHRESADRPVERSRSSRILRRFGNPWFIVASMCGELSLLVGGVVIAGMTGPLTPAGALLPLAGLFVLATLSYAAANGGMSDRLAHIPFAGMLAIVVWLVYEAGSAGTGLVDVFLFVGLGAFFVFVPRIAAAWFALSLVAMSVIAISQQFPNSHGRVAMTIGIGTIAAAMFAKIRNLSAAFIAKNVALSRTDPLTGLANIRVAREALEYSLRQAARGRETTAVVAIDLDDFKTVNDRHSHSFGDKLLRRVADALAASVRDGELVARRGGDEFLVICTPNDRSDLDSLERRIGKRIAEARLALAPEITPSATIASVLCEADESVDDLMRRADVALHERKVASHAARDARKLA